MNLSLQVQRQAPAGTAAPEACRNAENLPDWLDSLPEGKPLESARALVRELAAQRSAGLALRTRLKLLELVRDKAETLLPPIELRLDHATLPLTPGLQQAVMGANELLKALGAGYAEIVAGLARRWYAVGSDKPLLLAVSQGLRLNQRRLTLAYRCHARGSPNAWTEMHRLFRAARDGGVATKKMAESAATPQRIYANALLLAFAEPARFTAGDLDRVVFYLDRYGDLARIEAPPPVAGGDPSARFLIRAHDARPGMALAKWKDGELRPEDLVLRCDELAARIEHQIAGLEAGKAPATLGLPKEAEAMAYQALLTDLARLWRVAPSRRFHRTRFRPRVDVVVGCAALRRFIAGAAYRRRSRDEPGEPTPSGSMSEWTVTNESPDGLALRYVGGNAADVQVGEILGVRPRGGSIVHVCIVRRAEAAAASLEIGVQVLASHALPASISLPEPNGGAARKPLQVMLLPRLPGFGDAPALLAAPAALVPGMEFVTRIEGRLWLLRVAWRVEKTASCELFSLEKAERPMRATPAPRVGADAVAVNSN